MDTPMSFKDAWAKKNMEKVQSNSLMTLRQEEDCEKTMQRKSGKERWEHQLGIVPPRTPAHNGDLGRQRDKLHRGLGKAESSLASIKNRVRSIPSRPQGPRCDLSGAPEWLAASRPLKCQYLCPNNATTGGRLYGEAGTKRYQKLLSTQNGLRVVARLVMRLGLLGQFSLAREQMDPPEFDQSGG